MKLAERNCILVETPLSAADSVLAMLGNDQLPRVIDLYEPGCGEGAFMQEMLTLGVHSVFGIDKDPELIRRAKSNLWPHRKSVESLEQGDMLAIPVPRNANLVYCYLMHGLTELMFAKTLLENCAETCYFVSHNYPMAFPGIEGSVSHVLEPHKVVTNFYNWSDYPPYSRLYLYTITKARRESSSGLARAMLKEFREGTKPSWVPPKANIYLGSIPGGTP